MTSMSSRRNVFRRGVVAIVVMATDCTIAAGPATNVAGDIGAVSPNVYTPLMPAAGATTRPAPVGVAPIPDDLRRAFAIDRFYAKCVTVRGVPIIGSAKVSDFAFLEAAYQLDRSLAACPAWVIDAVVAAKVRLGIIATVEYTMDIPENRTKQNLVPKEAAFQDRRSRGLGGLPLATCAEENLLSLRSDPYRNENITLHEFAHTVASEIRRTRPAWYDGLKQTYARAMKDGLFANSYSATNEQEYWAEGVQAWFDCAARKKDLTVHSGIWHRDQLKAYDPRLAALIAEVYGDGDWRYVKATNEPVTVRDIIYTRPPDELGHLAGFDANLIPAFSFANSPRVRAVNRTK